MANYKRRKRSQSQRYDDFARKNFRVRGIASSNLYTVNHTNIRQGLKRTIWEGWE